MRDLRRALLALVLCAATLPAFSDALRILVPQSTSALPFFLLAKQNPIAGTAISVSTFVAHPQALALLLRGEADLLLTGTSQGWENRLDGSPIVMVDTGIWGISSLIGTDPKIKGFADLKGKRLALPFSGSPLDFQTRAILAQLKIDPDKDVTLSYGAFAQSIPKLMAGQLDAVALPEPQATQVVRDQGLLRIVTYADAWAAVNGGSGASPQVSLFATDTFAKSHTQLLRDVVAAWSTATAQVLADPAKAAATFAAPLAADPGVLQSAIGGTLFEVPGFADNKARVLAYYAQVEPYFPGPKRPLDDAFFFVP